VIELQITVPRRCPINVTFTRKEVSDSWDGLERNDMRQKGAGIVEELTKL
jgi:hypothetical protein